MKLSSLFLRCLNIEYSTYENDASFAIDIICDSLYIYFEHSNGIVDWKNNLDFPKRCGGCFCYHRGFLRVWNGIKDKVLKYIENPSFNLLSNS